MESRKKLAPDANMINDPEVERSLQQNLNTTAGFSSDDAFDKAFKPKGAVAFFVLLILLGMIIWFGIYFLMLSRI